MSGKHKSPKMIAAGKQAWKTRLANLRKRKRKGSRKGKVVGFYKDRGKTKPITKSAAQIQRKKVVAGGRKFGGVKPKNLVLKDSVKAYGRRDEVQNKYVDTYRKLKEEGINPDLGEFISQSGGLAGLVKGAPSLVTDVIMKFLRNKDNLSAEDKGEIGKYMFAMRPLFPLGVPKLIRDIAVAYPPSLIRGCRKEAS